VRRACNQGALTFRGRLSGTVHLVNPIEDRHFGRVVVELVTGRLESKSFVDTILHAVELSVAVDPEEAVVLPFDFVLPPTLPPGRDLYLRARLDERTALIMPVYLTPTLRANLDMPLVWQEGAEGTIRVLLHNSGSTGSRSRDRSMSLSAPELERWPRDKIKARLTQLATTPLAPRSLGRLPLSSTSG
jgi:hypothetical protein